LHTDIAEETTQMHTQKEKHTPRHTHTHTTTAATETSPTFFSHPPKKTITEVCRETKKKTVTAEIQQQEKTPD
jgi:hypothetical protein